MNGASQCNLCGTAECDGVITKNAHQIVRCRDCGLMRVHPQPSADRIKALYAPASGYQTHRFNEGNRYSAWEDRRARYLASVVGDAPDSQASVLDVGCATGTFLRYMRPRGWQVHGIEIGSHLVAHARSAHQLAVDIGAAENAREVYGDSSFDVITLWDVVEHLAAPRQAMASLVALLKPGGRLYLATPNADGWVARFHWQTIRRLWGVWPHPEPPRHLFQFSRATASRLCQAAGLTSVAVRHDEIPLWYSAGFVGEPTLRQWLRGDANAPRARLLYAVSAPAFAAARVARRGDSMIVSGRRPAAGGVGR